MEEDLYKNPFGFELKHVELDLEEWKRHDEEIFELTSSDKLYWAQTYRKDGIYCTDVYFGSLAKFQNRLEKAYLIANKKSRNIEEAVQFHFDALEHLNYLFYSAQ